MLPGTPDAPVPPHVIRWKRGRIHECNHGHQIWQQPNRLLDPWIRREYDLVQGSLVLHDLTGEVLACLIDRKPSGEGDLSDEVAVLISPATPRKPISIEMINATEDRRVHLRAGGILHFRPFHHHSNNLGLREYGCGGLHVCCIGILPPHGCIKHNSHARVIVR
ncbi:hypothetical protein BDV11DRAFT_201325 [Aspergillus similis]